MSLRSSVVVSFACLLISGDALAQAPGSDGPPPEPAPVQPGPPQPGPPQPMQPVMIQPAVVSPLAHTHHGVFLRFLIGPGGFDSKMTMGTDTYEVSGSGGGFSFAVGGAVSDSIVVYGEVFDDIATSPTFTMNGQSSGTGADIKAGVVGVGPGVAYYFPSNFYVGATLVASRISIQQNTTELAHSDTGMGVSAHLGKEWWVSDSWGLGVAGQVYAGTIPDGQANASWKTVGGSIAFSATYN